MKYKLISKLRQIVILLSVCVIGLKSADANHIIGGEATYRCLGSNGDLRTFEITFTMYRDMFGGGSPFDDPARFGLYIGSETNWTHEETFNIRPELKSELDLEDSDFCNSTISGIGAEVVIIFLKLNFRSKKALVIK